MTTAPPVPTTLAPPVPDAPPIAPPIVPPLVVPRPHAPTRPLTRTRERDRAEPRVRPRAEPRVRRRRAPLPRYVTYIKYNPRNGRWYVGRARGTVLESPDVIMRRREGGHHIKGGGWSTPHLDTVIDGTRPPWQRALDPAYWATRGREQQMIDFFGGARTDRRPGSLSDNAIRGVAKGHPLGRAYWAASTLAFGAVAPYTGNWKR